MTISNSSLNSHVYWDTLYYQSRSKGCKLSPNNRWERNWVFAHKIEFFKPYIFATWDVNFWFFKLNDVLFSWQVKIDPPPSILYCDTNLSIISFFSEWNRFRRKFRIIKHFVRSRKMWKFSPNKKFGSFAKKTQKFRGKKCEKISLYQTFIKVKEDKLLIMIW